MSVVWLDGSLTGAAAARIDPSDRGLTLGDGVFETLRAQGGAPIHADRHLARLRSGALVLEIALPFTDDVLFDAMCLVLSENGLSAGVLRLTLTRGPAGRGLLPSDTSHPTVLITGAPLAAAPSPARVVVAQRTRRNEHSPLAGIKSLNYLDSILARQEASRAGADDALLLNTAEDLAEATAANVFLLIDGRLVTPRLQDGALPGIARSLLLAAGGIQEKQVSREDVGRAEAGFLVNSLGNRTIRSIEGRELDTKHQALFTLK